MWLVSESFGGVVGVQDLPLFSSYVLNLDHVGDALRSKKRFQLLEVVS